MPDIEWYLTFMQEKVKIHVTLWTNLFSFLLSCSNKCKKITVVFLYSTKTMHFVELNIGVFMLNMNKNRIFSNLYFLCRLNRILIHSMCSVCCCLFKLNNTIAIFMNITFGKHVFKKSKGKLIRLAWQTKYQIKLLFK